MLRHPVWLVHLSALHRPDAVVGIHGRHGPTQDLNQESLALLLLPCLLRLLLMRLEDTQLAPLGLSVKPGHRLAEGQGLVLSEAEALGYHGCPERQDRRS